MKITFEQVRDIGRDNADITVDGELYEFHKEVYEQEEVDDNGVDRLFIMKRKSDGKFFGIWINWIRYGYENYGLETFTNDCDLEEMQEKEVVTRKWVCVR